MTDASSEPPRPVRPPRLLAGLTRARLLAILGESRRAWSVAELAVELHLHPNSVREQLEPLVKAGQVERMPTAPHGRGRPAFRFRALPELNEAAPYRDLARLLAEELARVPDAAARAIGAGERWGRAAIGTHLDGTRNGRAASSGAASDEPLPIRAPTERFVALLDAGGFAPEPWVEGQPIRLRRCPFVPLANEHRPIICGVHLGLMRGALAELGAPLEAVRLEPFVAPDLCLAHLAPRRREAP